MTAEHYYRENIHRPEIDWYGQEELITTLMREFALLKCEEQREICANEIVSNGSNNRSNILNSPTPEM